MKKKLIITGVALFLVLAFLYFKYIFGWLEFNKNNYTPNEYKSIIHTSKEQYLKDSLSLVSIIRYKINEHKNPYTNAIRVNGEMEYINDGLTKIYIDTIFYSQKLDKVAFLVVVENENKKQYKGKTKEEADSWAKEGNLPYEGTFFDGNCFIAKRNGNNFDTQYYGYSFTNSRTYKENSEELRNACLNFSNDRNEKEEIYNFDDSRFWNSKEWVLNNSRFSR